MKIPLRSFIAVLSISLVSNPILFGQTPPPVAAIPTSQIPQAAPAAPVPTQIASAHTVFLVNDGADANFPLSEDQAYNQVYAALQSWGRFQLVGSAEQADLVFNLHSIAPITNITGDRGSTYSVTSPAFKLKITDPKTHTDLWTITSPVTIVGKGLTRSHWNTIAVTNLVSRIKVLVNQTLTVSESADLTTTVKTHGLRTTLIIVGAAAAIGVGTAILIHHSLSDQKKNQDNFCIANGIPLNECAGG